MLLPQQIFVFSPSVYSARSAYSPTLGMAFLPRLGQGLAALGAGWYAVDAAHFAETLRWIYARTLSAHAHGATSFRTPPYFRHAHRHVFSLIHAPDRFMLPVSPCRCLASHSELNRSFFRNHSHGRLKPKHLKTSQGSFRICLKRLC